MLIGTGLFVLGGILALGYSDHPLHGAIGCKVYQLEERIDARNLSNLKLTNEVTCLRASESTQADPASVAKLEDKVTKTRDAYSFPGSVIDPIAVGARTRHPSKRSRGTDRALNVEIPSTAACRLLDPGGDSAHVGSRRI